MTQPEAIYAALKATGRTEFTLPDIVVIAWKAHPDLFGLPGYPLPDSHRIVWNLCGSSRGMVHRGELVKLPGKRYRLGEPKPHPRGGQRAQGAATRFLAACAETVACKLAARSLLSAVDHADAAELWALTPVGGDGTDAERFGRYLAGLDDDDERVRVMKSLHNYCLSRFARRAG